MVDLNERRRRREEEEMKQGPREVSRDSRLDLSRSDQPISDEKSHTLIVLAARRQGIRQGMQPGYSMTSKKIRALTIHRHKIQHERFHSPKQSTNRYYSSRIIYVISTQTSHMAEGEFSLHLHLLPSSSSLPSCSLPAAFSAV